MKMKAKKNLHRGNQEKHRGTQRKLASGRMGEEETNRETP